MIINNDIEKGNRTAEYIVDHGVPMSDLTDEEIDRLIDYRAEIKARDEEYQARMDQLNETLRNVSTIHEQAAASARERLDALIVKAMTEEK